MGRGKVFLLAIAAGVTAACVDKKQIGCDPNDDSCNVISPGSNGCHQDSDCGDGKCLANGTCQPYNAVSQPSACAGVKCGTNEFCSNGKCLPTTAQCKPADPSCIYIPHNAFEPPVHAWWWPWQTPGGPDDKTGNDKIRPDVEYPDYTQVMSTPVVIRLHPNDPEPAVVFNSFFIPPNQPSLGDYVEVQGVMRAIRGSDGSPIWSAPNDMFHHMEWSINGNSSIAAGDCMGTGEVCFVTGGWDPADAPPKMPPNKSHQHGGLIAFGSDGRFLWVNRAAQVWWGGPSIARLLGPTGPAQVVVGNGVYDGATGKTLCPQTINPLDQVGGNGDGTLTAIADLDLDGVPEIVTGNQAYKLLKDASSPTGYTCKALFGAGVQMPNGRDCPGGYKQFCPDGFPAVANFAGYGSPLGLKPDDPHPQIVTIAHGYLNIHDWTGGMVVAPIPLPGRDTRCYNPDYNPGGAPTIADFDGDGLPEVGVASQSTYSVWKPGVGWIWSSGTFDCSANTGSSVFDFEGKGQATVVYSDQCYFRVYDGKSGQTLIQEQNSSCTASEMPIVADIDGSGRAKILVPNNNICPIQCPWAPSTDLTRYWGLKALTSPSDKWVNTRSVWNEHAYHVTNVNLDGTLPWPEPNSWDKAQGGFNNYRQNIQGKGMFSSPDLSVCEVKVDMTQCHGGKAIVTTTVYNGGALLAKPGVPVTITAVLENGQTAPIGSAVTKTTLHPGESETINVEWMAPPANQSVTVKAVVDPNDSVGDCHRENNVASSARVKCSPMG